MTVRGLAETVGQPQIGYPHRQYERLFIPENVSSIDSSASNGGSRKKYVFACAVFASLNSVLLGYDLKQRHQNPSSKETNYINDKPSPFPMTVGSLMDVVGKPTLAYAHSKYQKITDSATVSGIPSRGTSSRKYIFSCAVLASLNSILLGYDVGVMSGAILFIHEDLKITEVQEEVLVGCLSIVSLLGSLVGGRTSDAIGRKWTMGVAAIIFQIGAALMALAPSFAVLMMGRLLAGVGIGFGVIIAPVYIAEISPATSRGALTSFPEIFINLGILLGYVSNYAFSDLPSHISWRVMLAAGIFPSVFIAIALCVIPESPRWLVMKNHATEAKAVLVKITDSEAEVEETFAEIQESARVCDGADKAVYRELLTPSPTLLRMLITGVGIQCFQQVTGIDATVYYSPTIFKAAGIDGKRALLGATVAVGFTKTLFILVAILLIERVGRKPLLYVSTIGMTTCLFGLGLGLTFMGHGFGSKELGIGIAVLTVCGNVAFFSVGIGPICWVLTSEIFPLRFRAQATALGAVGNRVCSGLVAMSFLSVARLITVGGTFFVFSVISALSVAFVYAFVPETKGKSLEEIEMLFKDGRACQKVEVELGDLEHLVQNQKL